MDYTSSTQFQSVDSQNALLAPPINSSQTINEESCNKHTSELETIPSSTVVNVPPGSYYYAEPGTTEMFSMPSAPTTEVNYYFQPSMIVDQSKLDYYPPQQQMVTIPQPITTVQISSPESTSDCKSMFLLGVALAIISWILQLFGVTLFALIAIIAAQVILWNNYHSHQHSVDETKKLYAQKSRKMAIIHLILSIVMVIVGVVIIFFSTLIIVAAYIIVYVVAMVTAGSAVTSR